MSKKIVGKMAGCYSPIGNTFILQDESGNELATGVVTEQEQVFDATVADVKVGKTFASDDGVKVGEDTKTYRTEHASYLILPNESFSIPLEKYEQYNYTKFQAMISIFNTTVSDSVSVTKVSLYDSVYDMNSSSKLSDVTKNMKTKCIDLNIMYYNELYKYHLYYS